MQFVLVETIKNGLKLFTPIPNASIILAVIYLNRRDWRFCQTLRHCPNHVVLCLAKLNKRITLNISIYKHKILFIYKIILTII